MLIGTSLGRCMVSILNDEVDRNNIGLIITRTKAAKYEHFLEVIDGYYSYGARVPAGYDFSGHTWEAVEDLADFLWHGGRIHQPRNFTDSTGYLLPEMKTSLWMEVVPTLDSTNSSVVQAYEHYQLLRTLAK